MDRRDIVPILSVSDDVLEHIIQIVVQDTDGRCGHKDTVTLSHVCSRLRQVILLRAAFWNDLTVNETTSSDAVEAVLHRSQSVPLHIDIVGSGEFRQIRDSGVTLEMLFEAVAKRLATANSLYVSDLNDLDSEVLARACETVNQMRSDTHPRELSITFSFLKYPTLDLVVGAHLANLNLIFIMQSLAATLSKIFNLAPNIEVLYVQGQFEGTNSQEFSIEEPPAHGSRLQILQLDSGGVKKDDFARAIELVQLYSPQAIADGRIVELRDASNAACIEKMELNRFKGVESIIYSNASRFTITYLARNISTQRPVGAHALAEQIKESSGTDLVTRGFDADLSDLLEHECPARGILRTSITMARSLKVNSLPWIVLDLFSILAHDVWPTLERISVELYTDLSFKCHSSEWNGQLINAPRLHTVDFALRSIRSESEALESPSEEVIQSWANTCVAIMNAFSSSNTTRFIVRSSPSDDDPEATASILAAIRQARPDL